MVSYTEAVNGLAAFLQGAKLLRGPERGTVDSVMRVGTRARLY